MNISIPNYHLTHITSFTVDWIDGEKLGSIQRISFTAQIRVALLASTSSYSNSIVD